MAAKQLPDGRVPLLLSAHAEELVAVDARAIADYLDRFPAVTPADVAQQLRKTRRVRRHRAVLRAADRLELADALRALADGREHSLVAKSSLGSAPGQAFVFPGQGGQWPGMGAVAYQELPAYRTAIGVCVTAFEASGIGSPLRYLTATDDPHTFTEIEVEGAQFAHAVALAQVWLSCGVLPDLTVGHSLGEVAAAYIAGRITLPDAVAVVAARAGVVDRLPGRYAVAALGVGENEARRLITATEGWLELSVVNGPSTVAVSGDRDAVLAIIDAVRGSGQFAREIPVGFPVHTSVLEPLREELRARLPVAQFADAPVLFIGGTTGDLVPAGTDFADYWYANLRHTVRFDHAVESAIRRGATSFIEISANPALAFAMSEIFETRLPKGPAVHVGSARRDEPLLDALAANIVTAAAADPAHAWADLAAPPSDDVRPPGLPGFPNAPMRAVPMWAHPEPLEPLPSGRHGKGTALTVALERWERMTLSASGAPARVAVVDIGADRALARSLRAALESHPAARLSEPRDAELVVAVAPELSAESECAAEELTGLIGTGRLDYAEAAGPRCHTVCLVTVGAEQVDSHDAPPSAGHAALAAMHRSVGYEYSDLTFTQLDLPTWEPTPVGQAAAVEALLTGSGCLALRECRDGQALFARTLRDAAPAPGWPQDTGLLDDVVITGGAGAVGLHYARYFAERGARRIVLLSRRPADPVLLNALAGQHGTVLVSPPCDITDSAELGTVAAEYGAAGASLVVHAAGSATFGRGVTAAAFADTVAAKVGGLARMARLWPVRPDGRMVLCSSVSGLWGGRGHVAYSAANRLLDVMAARLRAEGRHCVAIRWGLWQSPRDGAQEDSQPGIVDAAEVANIERSGLRPMVPLDAIDASLRDWHADPLVFSGDAARLRIFLSAMRSEEPSDPQLSDMTNVTVVDAVRGQLAAVLGLQHGGELDLAESLFDLGVDSMLAVDLRKRLKRLIGRTVPLAHLLDDITGEELIVKLEDAGERPEAAQKVDITRD